MNNYIKLIAMALCVTPLSSCMMNDDQFNSSYSNYSYYDRSNLYAPTNYRFSNYGYSDGSNRGVTVPESYHLGAYHSPISFKDRDRDWVSSQNPQSYTIEIANDEKAAVVAKKLYKAPKNDRMAQVKFQHEGKSYYKGLYGTYNSPEAAQKALEALPPEIKQGAGVKNWSTIQNSLNE